MPDTSTPTESRMKRLHVGDKVSFEDYSEHPPIHMEGKILEFANVEGTYLKVEFTDDKDKTVEKELTEDDVQRIA